MKFLSKLFLIALISLSASARAAEHEKSTFDVQFVYDLKFSASSKWPTQFIAQFKLGDVGTCKIYGSAVLDISTLLANANPQAIVCAGKDAPIKGSLTQKGLSGLQAQKTEEGVYIIKAGSSAIFTLE